MFFCSLCSTDICDEVNASVNTKDDQSDGELSRTWNVSSQMHLEKGGTIAPLLPLEFYCDECQEVIPPGAYRWRCLECVSYDNCEACINKRKLNDPHKTSHHQVKIMVRRPGG